MGRKPDMIRTIALIFTAGLIITGFTSLQASEQSPRSAEPWYQTITR
ncbi:hypothetical protein [Marinobacter psychrophilus]|nr:hypothetical protein [Marinobacter psychrophilus]MBQ0764326.1 hypothetical protein [Marinobacter psychrophilus]MBQ0845106.1 hypothetical protein [Marinobacter psychrophilus]